MLFASIGQKGEGEDGNDGNPFHKRGGG
jgi:hypothetical protein